MPPPAVYGICNEYRYFSRNFHFASPAMTAYRRLPPLRSFSASFPFQWLIRVRRVAPASETPGKLKSSSQHILLLKSRLVFADPSWDRPWLTRAARSAFPGPLQASILRDGHVEENSSRLTPDRRGAQRGGSVESSRVPQRLPSGAGGWPCVRSAPMGRIVACELGSQGFTLGYSHRLPPGGAPGLRLRIADSQGRELGHRFSPLLET